MEGIPIERQKRRSSARPFSTSNNSYEAGDLDIASSWFQSYQKSLDYFTPLALHVEDNDTNLASDDQSSIFSSEANIIQEESDLVFSESFAEPSITTADNDRIQIMHDSRNEVQSNGRSARVKSVAGRKSSFGQTIFNSINVFLGLGILALPFAFKIDGWIIGISLILIMAIVTRITALMLIVNISISSIHITHLQLTLFFFRNV